MPELMIMPEEIKKEGYFLKLVYNKQYNKYGGIKIGLRLLSYELNRGYIDIHLLGVSEVDISVNK